MNLLTVISAAAGVMGLLTGLVALVKFAEGNSQRRLAEAAGEARRQAEAVALEARHEAALTALKAQIDRAHEKIRALDEHGREVDGWIIELRADIKYIREGIADLKRVGGVGL